MSDDALSDPVASLVREVDFGRYAATLFAPAPVRSHLFALYAFDIEISRVRDLVREPMPGELRLQWWRDALENPERADVLSHPIARALHAAIVFGRLPTEALLAIVDARGDDLYDDPVASLDELEGRLGTTHGAVLRLASLIVAEGRDPGGAAACGLAGVAQGIASVLGGLPKLAARGQALIPAYLMAQTGAQRDDLLSGRATPQLRLAVERLAGHGVSRLGEARAAMAEMDRGAHPALLPVALAAAALARIERRPDPFGAPRDPARWRELIRLWRFSRRDPPF
ncbi:phytoene/squalene synthase family protein [Chenggangzhangella methanolivorans]|uniref:Squalene/phytoene synthase family protein n=1 Tax=Chenggangzhangella methanolivorans TaxID=1437009 RepID=A0A9E6UPP6_9HYPH|nr:squalene/phytoene synthase family protein [Chenggangzhangella methanolivorans]QZN99989.1 squalene/phytoene synthase family protein [Chenggangzhangella methanolivorans]